MKSFKIWTNKIKLTFALRLIAILITIGLLVAIIAARGEISLLVAGGSFIASIFILVFILAFELQRLYSFAIRANRYYDKVKKVEEASKDPIILNAIRELRIIVEDLDLETMKTIRKIMAKEEITKTKAALTLAKTEDVLKSVLEFASKYPGLKPNGVKEPRILVAIYNKRIEALKELI